jgi:hypothetical protein
VKGEYQQTRRNSSWDKFYLALFTGSLKYKKMISKIPYKFALNAMIAILLSVLIFHVLILIKIIPYTIVWAGKLENDQQMVVFEILSITVNSVLTFIIFIQGNYLKVNFSQKALNVILWVFTIIFSLNTIGNLFSKTSFETIVFTPLTFISAILCYRILRK